MERVAGHTGPVWINVISLKREDAVKMGYEDIGAWQALLRRHLADMSKAFRIDPDRLEWYAAFHNESHHPHCHLVILDREGKQGHLSRKGIEGFRSGLARDIFRNELKLLYDAKTVGRENVKEAARLELLKAAGSLRGSTPDMDTILPRMQALGCRLQGLKGKRHYGYLNRNLKQQVDEIVDLLAKEAVVKVMYEKWMVYQRAIKGIYKDDPEVEIPLSRNQEFKSIKNEILKEAVILAYAENPTPEGMAELRRRAESGDRICSVVCEELQKQDAERKEQGRREEMFRTALLGSRLMMYLEKFVNGVAGGSQTPPEKITAKGTDRELKIRLGQKEDDTESEENLQYMTW